MDSIAGWGTANCDIAARSRLHLTCSIGNSGELIWTDGLEIERGFLIFTAYDFEAVYGAIWVVGILYRSVLLLRWTFEELCSQEYTISSSEAAGLCELCLTCNIQPRK